MNAGPNAHQDPENGVVRVRLTGETFNTGHIARILRDHPEIEFIERPTHYSGGRLYLKLRIGRAETSTKPDEEATR